MRIWVDLTASAHPIVMRPIVERLRQQGHEVEITARDTPRRWSSAACTASRSRVRLATLGRRQYGMADGGRALRGCALLQPRTRRNSRTSTRSGNSSTGPLHAGTFGPNELDNTFGPEVKFIKAPGADKQNLPPSARHQFFGHVRIDGASGKMTVTLRDRADVALWSTTLDPKRR